ncbi:MAG: hypothetical protein Q7J31_00250, partial [Syntrophales bacterium]|nr:hypothetical protein [Syntrophales bacterium]
MMPLRSLRLSLRFIIPLGIALTLLAYAVVPLLDKLTLRWFVRDMDIRSQLIANTLHDPLAELLQQRNKAKINALLLRTIQDERLLALGYCDGNGTLLYRTPTFPKSLGCSSPASKDKATSPIHQLPQGGVH